MNEDYEESKLRRLAPVLGGVAVLMVLGVLGYAAVNSLGGTAPPQ